MRTVASLAAVIVLAACSGPGGTPARAYAHFVDRFRAATGGIINQPCFRGEFDRLPDEQCYRMGPPQRMRGVWVEGRGFFPGATDIPPPEVRDEITLNVRDHRVPVLFPEGEHYRAFLVDFIGVQTVYAGGYGHLGGSDHLVVVQRLISSRLLDDDVLLMVPVRP